MFLNTQLSCTYQFKKSIQFLNIWAIYIVFWGPLHETLFFCGSVIRRQVGGVSLKASLRKTFMLLVSTFYYVLVSVSH